MRFVDAIARVLVSAKLRVEETPPLPFPSNDPPRSQFPKRIAVIPGDGIGPEVIAEALNVLQALPSAPAKQPWN